jgi:hypothetical protein
MERAFLAAAYVYDGQPRSSIVEVTVVREVDGKVLYERENGVRDWHWNGGNTIHSIHATRAAAELWCAEKFDGGAAPILAAAAALREAAAARVAGEEVAVV